MAANIMNSKILWPVAALHVVEDRVQQIAQQLGVQEVEDWVSRIDNVDSLDVAIRTNFLQHQIGLSLSSNELCGAKSLTDSQRSDGNVVLTP